MQLNAFDRFQQQNSLIHQLDPRVKVIITVLFIVANVLLPDGAWLGFIAAWLFLLTIALLAKIPVATVYKRTLIVFPFMLAAVTVLFTLPGDPLWSWQVGSRTIVISDSGLLRFVSIVIRSWLAVQMAVLLTAATSFPDLMHALTHLRVPAILVSIIAFMYRYLFVLADEAMRLMRARTARSASLSGGMGSGSIVWQAKVTGNMIGQLLVRILDRSDRVYQAMLSRGYDGRYLTLHSHQMGRQDWILAAVGVLIILLIQFMGRLF